MKKDIKSDEIFNMALSFLRLRYPLLSKYALKKILDCYEIETMTRVEEAREIAKCFENNEDINIEKEDEYLFMRRFLIIVEYYDVILDKDKIQTMMGRKDKYDVNKYLQLVINKFEENGWITINEDSKRITINKDNINEKVIKILEKRFFEIHHKNQQKGAMNQ